MSLLVKKDKWLIMLGTFALFIALVGTAYYYKNWKSSNLITLATPECDPNQEPCAATLPTGEEVTLRIKPTHMPVLTTLQMEVKTEKIQVKKITIFFKGAEMNMGEFSCVLNRQKDGIYKAQTILPTCINDNMVWHAVIHIDAINKHYTAPFRIINQRPVANT